MQEQAVNHISLPLSIRWTKHQRKNMRENEVLKNEHIQAHLKNWEVVQEESSFSKALDTVRKHMILHLFSSNCQLHKVYKSCPGANLRYPSDFEIAPHFTMMNVHRLLVYAKSYFLHHCFVPSCTFSKARCSVWLLYAYRPWKKIHTVIQKGKKNISPKGRWKDGSKFSLVYYKRPNSTQMCGPLD